MNLHRLRGARWSGALMRWRAVAARPRRSSTFDIPAGAHFNQDKLAKITEFFKNEVATGKIAGANVLIQQHGKPVYHETFGVQDVVVESADHGQDHLPPVVADQGDHIRGGDAVGPGRQDQARRSRLEIHSLLRQYEGRRGEKGRGRQQDARTGAADHGPSPFSTCCVIPPASPTASMATAWCARPTRTPTSMPGEFDLAEFAERIAKLPLHNQPGALWQYGHSTDILARIMEIVSGRSLLEIEKEKLLDPLGMVDTNFFVTEPEQRKRLAPAGAERQRFPGRPPVPHRGSPEVGIRQRRHGFDHVGFLEVCADAGSTAARSSGKTYLSPKTFELMASDHTGKDSGVERDHYYFPGDGFGMGLGLAVRTDPGNAKPPPPGSLGELKWDGAAGCYMVIDRKQDMFFVVLEQTPTGAPAHPADVEADGL